MVKAKKKKSTGKNKTFRKFSKKTTGKAVDTVADYIDLASQLVVEYFNTRYKITKRYSEVRKAILNGLYGLKAGFIKAIVEAIFLCTGLIAFIVGGILFLNRFLPLDGILAGYGLLVIVIVVFGMKTKV